MFLQLAQVVSITFAIIFMRIGPKGDHELKLIRRPIFM